ncbi:hypothetical protein IAT38_000718 [Cryptococcus sp. DSM 104549]
MPIPQEPSWASDLPTLESVFVNNTNSLLRPFSIFSISFFRPTPSLPSPPLLEALTAISTLAPTDTVDDSAAVKAIGGLQRFASQLRDAVAARKLSPEYEQVVASLETLLRGYASGFHVIGRAIWDSEGSSSGAEMSRTDMEEGIKQCLHGIFAVRVLLAEHAVSLAPSDKEILGAIFPTLDTNHHLLSTLFDHSRLLITSLQAKPIRPFAQFKLKPALPSPALPPLAQSVTDAEVSFIVELLETEEEKRRPLRVAMEAKALHCDLAMSMTNKRIAEVKARTARRFSEDGDGAENAKDERGGVEDDGDGDGGEDCVDDLQLRQEVEDLKPDVSKLGDEGGTIEGSVHADAPAAEKVRVGKAVAWEEIAEKALVECLDVARALLEDGRAAVLSDEVTPVEWLGSSGVPSPSVPLDTHRKSKSLSNNDSASDSDSSYDASDSESESSHASEADLVAHACPLRTLFRLIDRYEEQRLAVWLSLPAAKRGKMTAFMQGEEGRVGMAWDGFGLRAMMEYDGDTLLSYGLAAEKLDKWTELAAARNAKKIRRKGRKTV